MRNMPKFIHDPISDQAIELPTVSSRKWESLLEQAAGRPLTDDEKRRADKMGAHNWTLRIVIENLFGIEAARKVFPVFPVEEGGAK